mgnify:CR=1 FL=1
MRWLRRLWARFFGLWRVVYSDGQVSKPMPYRAARNYADVFHARIVPDYEYTEPRK